MRLRGLELLMLVRVQSINTTSGINRIYNLYSLSSGMGEHSYLLDIGQGWWEEEYKVICKLIYYCNFSVSWAKYSCFSFSVQIEQSIFVRISTAGLRPKFVQFNSACARFSSSASTPRSNFTFQPPTISFKYCHSLNIVISTWNLGTNFCMRPL